MFIKQEAHITAIKNHNTNATITPVTIDGKHYFEKTSLVVTSQYNNQLTHATDSYIVQTAPVTSIILASNTNARELLTQAQMTFISKTPLAGPSQNVPGIPDTTVQDTAAPSLNSKEVSTGKTKTIKSSKDFRKNVQVKLYYDKNTRTTSSSNQNQPMGKSEALGE